MNPKDESEETFTVRVFLDHPRWDSCEKWFMLPTALLQELHVATYVCTDTGPQMRWIEKRYPGCVYVY